MYKAHSYFSWRLCYLGVIWGWVPGMWLPHPTYKGNIDTVQGLVLILCHDTVKSTMTNGLSYRIVDWELTEKLLSGECHRTSLINEKSILVQVMACCHQATSHYLSQCWPRSVSPYGIIRPQWVTDLWQCHVAVVTVPLEILMCMPVTATDNTTCKGPKVNSVVNHRHQSDAYTWRILALFVEFVNIFYSPKLM